MTYLATMCTLSILPHSFVPRQTIARGLSIMFLSNVERRIMLIQAGMSHSLPQVTTNQLEIGILEICKNADKLGVE
jgi:hypothetical protein